MIGLIALAVFVLSCAGVGLRLVWIGARQNLGPAWYPLGSTQIAIFDETEQPVTTATCPSGDPTCTTTILIPNEAQRVNVATDLLAPFNFGWTYLNLQHSGLGPAYADNFAQMWLEVRMEANGRFSVGMNGIQFDNANTPITTIIPVP